MSVQEKDVIDFISFDNQGRVILTISDHLDWEAEGPHLLTLQEKINTYCSYILNGELHINYPAAKEASATVIRVIGFYDPPVLALKFFAAVKRSLLDYEYIFEFQMSKKALEDGG